MCDKYMIDCIAIIELLYFTR